MNAAINTSGEFMRNSVMRVMTVVAIFAVAAPAGITLAVAPVFDARAQAAADAAFERVPDTQGTGSFPAMKEEDPSLPNHVIYRPATLADFHPGTLGVLLWGNGGCAADGAGSRLHLEEIASHGYVAIANGKVLSGPGSPAHVPPTGGNGAAPGSPGFKPPPPATQSADLTAALDWILKEDNRRGSPYFHRINRSWVAVSGWSCGGLQALEVAGDERVKTVVIHSSGIFNSGNPLPGINITKADLQKIHSSVIYLLGGPDDIAYENGMDDFHRITRVPAVVVNLPVGHGGTFRDANGGREASVVVSWLDWQFKGDKIAARRFMGPKCGLCIDPQWTIERRNL